MDKKPDQDVEKALSPEKTKEHAAKQPTIDHSDNQDDILNQLDQFEQPSPVKENAPPLKHEAPKENLIEDAPLPPSPQQTYFNQPVSSSDFSSDQVEAIVNEKWEEFLTRIGDINLWKETMNNELIAIKQEIIRTQDHFKNLQGSVLGKVGEYNQNISNINTEMKALEKVFQKILEPLTTNIKELSRITEKLKSK